MYRSDRIYLSKFAVDQDPEYLALEDFDLDCEIDIDEFKESSHPGIKNDQDETNQG